MTTRQTLTDQHSFINDTIFRTKTFLLTGKRSVQNLFSSLKRFKNKGQLNHRPIISFSESDLWNPFDNADNWILTAGKIENLRIAARRLNGVEIKANEVFSFWKHIGNPNLGKGYVIGREIREGCIVPTIAGGLCQLSNALYDAALKAGFTITERHKHTKVIKGSLAEQDRDATVKWNYVDLRFRSGFDFKIEVSLNSDKLIVVFRSQQKNITDDEPQKHTFRESNKLNDCYSCGNLACYKHPDKTSVKQDLALTTFILDEKWPEYDDYIQSISQKNDFFVLSLRKNRFVKTDRYDWTTKKSDNVHVTQWEGFWRALKLRLAARSKNNIFELSLRLDKKIAERASGLIPVESTHVVISQNLLPFLYATGALEGRTYDVLITRLPIEKIHERLDFAYRSFPESKTLKDFRAPENLIALENKALTKARKIITPHREIAEIFNNKAIKLPWILPKSTSSLNKGNKIFFPASAIGRKGAYEIKRLATELNLSLVLTGAGIGQAGFWKDIKIEKFNGNFEEIGLVYPVYIEHQPRQLFKFLSKGISVITTSATGMEETEKLKIIPIGNYEQLKEEVLKFIAKKAAVMELVPTE